MPVAPIQFQNSTPRSAERGMSLVSLLVVAAIVGMTLVLTLQLYGTQLNMNRFMEQKSDIVDMKAQLLHILADPAICTCQVNPNLTTDPGVDKQGLYFNSTATNQSITLNSIRAGCAASDPAVIKVAQPYGNNGATVTGIQLTNLSPTGVLGQWYGKWNVQIQANGKTMRPVEVSQFFAIDPTALATTPSHVFISPCLSTEVNSAGGIGSLGSCPSGGASGPWHMIGQPGMIGTYCIQETEQPAATYFAAKAACANMLTAEGYGPAHICEHNEWISACSATGMPNMAGNWQWVEDLDGDYGSLHGGTGVTNDDYCTNAPASCKTVCYGSVNSSDNIRPSNKFRCCIR